MPDGHQALIVEFPIFIAVRTEPVSAIIVPFVSEPHGDSPIGERPELFDETIVELTCPFSLQKFHDLLPAIDELRTIPPAARRGIRHRNALGVPGVPGIFR